MSLRSKIAALPLAAMMMIPASAMAASGLSVPFTGTVTSSNGTKTPIAGVLNVSNFAVTNGQLVANGTLNFPANGTEQIMQVAMPVTAATGTCPILSLTLGPLHLDLLGLVIDLNQVKLNITAQSGPGNLLGNLLCDIVGILDNNGGLGNLTGTVLNLVTNLLNQVLGQL